MSWLRSVIGRYFTILNPSNVPFPVSNKGVPLYSTNKLEPVITPLNMFSPLDEICKFPLLAEMNVDELPTKNVCVRMSNSDGSVE